MNKYILWRPAMVIADGRQDGPSEWRWKTTTVLMNVHVSPDFKGGCRWLW